MWLPALSLPNAHPALQKSEIAKNSWLFDLDDQWSKLPNFFKYDFNEPSNVPAELHHSFDLVLIDPPFITEDVWRKFAETTRLLLAPEGRVIASTVAENEPLMKDILGVVPVAFKPSIPHLVYQYKLYANYETKLLGQPNPEIPEYD